jgi:protein ATS1
MALYALGSNSSYQLSLKHTDDVSIPTKTTLDLPDEELPVKIASGGNHTLLLTNKGSLYATGANRYGQCMTPACDYIRGLKRLDGAWADCAATWEGSVGIDDGGRVWSFGKIKDHENLSGWKPGQDALVAEVDRTSSTPGNRCKQEAGAGAGEKSKVVGVFAGVQHFVVLTTAGVLGFGDSRKGQLGISQSIQPSAMSSETIVQAACGKDFTCLLSATGHLELHTTSTKHHLHNIPPQRPIRSLVASWSTIALLDVDGKVTSWGRSDHGQFPPAGLPRISQVAAGSEHFIALSEDHRVYAWGWNEHGNCGREDKMDVTSVHELAIPGGEKAMYVAAGCGTSWIWTKKLN